MTGSNEHTEAAVLALNLVSNPVNVDVQMHSIKFGLVCVCINVYCYPISDVSVNQLPVMTTTYKALICILLNMVEYCELYPHRDVLYSINTKFLQLNYIIIARTAPMFQLEMKY